MKIKKIIGLFALCLWSISSLFAQSAMGKWQMHLPYHQAIAVAVTEDKVYCATDVSMFSYSKKDKSLEPMSKITGLSDMSFSALAYSTDYKTVLIGYSNGNIDLLKGGKVYNFSDIKRKQIYGSKAINNISIVGKYAYMASGFGIVVFDLQRMEIKDTYIIDEAQTGVNAVASDGTHLWAATNKGIYMASLNGVNLLDYSNWSRITLTTKLNTFRTIVCFNDKVYALYKDTTFRQDQLWVYDKQQWTKMSDYTILNTISVSANKLIIMGDYIDVFDAQGQRIRHLYTYGNGISVNVFAAAFDSDNQTLWAADKGQGLVRNWDSWGNELMHPDGPSYYLGSDISIVNNRVWIASGGDIWSSEGFYSFIDDKWKSYDRGQKKLDRIFCINHIKVNPLNPSQVFATSQTGGILQIENNEIQTIYNTSNSTLQYIPAYAAEKNIYTRIQGIDYDTEGNVWVANFGVQHPISKRNIDGSWINFPEFQLNSYIKSDYSIADLLVTKNANNPNQKWVVASGHGVFIFDETKGAKIISVTSKTEQATDKVYAITEDNSGRIWLGTNQGAYYYANPENAFSTTESFLADYPKVKKTGDTVQHLLNKEEIRAIAVDGANRIWFGTSTSGVYLMGEDGTKEIHHFDISNSPLPSNNILKITVNPSTGDVYFGTDKGIISYKSDASDGNDDFSKAYVYPNPVKHGYEGLITITGLAKDNDSNQKGVYVKITDISGNLVSEMQANGGTATWNGKTLSGRRVQTGVYLVFCTSKDGSRTFVTKILFIN